MRIKYSVNFYLEKRKNKDGNLITKNVPIFLYFSFDGKRLQYYTGYRIDFSEDHEKSMWDEEKQQVRRNKFNQSGISANEINDHLDEIRVKVIDIYKECKALKQFPTVQYIRNELKKRLGDYKEKQFSFFDVFDMFIESESKINTWTPGTLERIKNVRNQLEQFKEYTRCKIEFDELNDTFFTKYIDYLREKPDQKNNNNDNKPSQKKKNKEKEPGQRNSTIAKNLKILKWFLNWATKKGYNKNQSYKDFTPGLKGTNSSKKIIFLTWDELLHLYNLAIPKKYLEQVRDVFCFCCFTGLRYSDVYNLKRTNIKENTVEITTIKTSDTLSIELNDYSRAILQKYANIHFEDDKCLPIISNQKMNTYLKELGQSAEFNQIETVVYYRGAKRIEETYQKWELLTTHVGRKTFVTNALFFNIPAEVIMQWTGHKDHKVMENYYKIVDSHKRREMNKFNEK